MRVIDWIDRDGEYMSRHVLRRAETVEVFTRIEERTCDKCGSSVSKNEYNDPSHMANELEIFLNADDCVNSRFRRDYCSTCLESIWTGICQLISADPDDISGSSFEDDE